MGAHVDWMDVGFLCVQEDRSNEACQSLRKLRAETKERMARQKVTAHTSRCSENFLIYDMYLEHGNETDLWPS